MRDRLRALFLNEGSLGPAVMGPARAGEALAAQLENAKAQLDDADVDAHYRALPPMGVLARNVTRGVPLLERADLDLHASRWHLVQAARARRALREEVERLSPHVIHLHGHTLSFLATREMRHVPTLLSVDATVWDWHAMEIWRGTRAHSRALLGPSIRLERKAFSAAARVLAWTAWTATGVKRQSPAARVTVHHPGVDLQRFRPAARDARERPRALFVGGRFEAKGGLELVDALGSALGREIDLDVVTPDPVPRREGLTVHRLEPGSPGLVGLFQQADVFCLPTRGDAAPFAVLEAMACATPVVSYDVGAVAELLGGDRAGRVVPGRDRARLRAEVLAVARDPELRERLGTAGRSLCERRFDERVQLRQLVDLLRAAAEEGAPR
jgi:glycosyltransferase involved in cell wall biosynthesis